MSYVVGIDYDSQSVYLVFVNAQTGDLDGLKRYDLAAGPGDSFQRARRAGRLMPPRERWEGQDVEAIGLEATLSRQRTAIAALSRVQGAILAMLPETIPVYPLAVQAWKKATVGKSNASKPEVAAWAKTHGAPPGLVQDFYDAFSIAKATIAATAALPKGAE